MKTKKIAIIYDKAIAAIPILCFPGIAAIWIGVIRNNTIVTTAGTALFLTGLAIWGLANGGAMVWAAYTSIKKLGFKDFHDSPWSSLYFLTITVFFLSVGLFFVKMLWRLFAKT